MHPVIQKTLGGLSSKYYFRQMFFSFVIGAVVYSIFINNTHESQVGLWVLAVFNLLLYPYSRFVYESIVGFILGENVFFVNGMFLLTSKLVTMLMCWWLAVLIAPIGLVYLYIHHSKTERA